MWDKTKQKLNFQAQELKVPTIRMTEKKERDWRSGFFRLFAFENGLCLSSDNNRYILDRANEYEWAHTFKHSQ